MNFNALQDTNFQDIIDSLELLKTQVETWRDKAREWAENAEDVEVESGEYSARHHALKAEADRIVAEAAQLAAETAENDSVLAQQAAEAAQIAAELAQGVAEQEAIDAGTARQAAEDAQSSAEAALSAVQGLVNEASDARNDAIDAQQAAEAAAGLSIQGIKVIDRLNDTSEYPATPDAGDAYVIENSSTEEDEIHLYTGSDWTVFPVGSGTSWGQISGSLANQSDLSSALSGKLSTSLKGSVNGLAELDGDGRVPSTQLPSYVDDVLEYADEASFPAEGETGKIYVAKDVNLTFRWTGSAYVEISPSIALGETSQTAYRGDRGKTAYDHSQVSEGNPHGVTKDEVGLGDADNAPHLAVAGTTPDITFDRPRIFGTHGAPGSNNIANDLSGAKQGIVQKIYHNSSTEPTRPAGWILLAGEYVTDSLNIIYAEWVSGTRVEYWIVQEVV